MQTYSHAILTAALRRPLKKWHENNPDAIPPVRSRALMLGSILPDFLLIMITAGTILIDWQRGVFRNPDFANIDTGAPTPPELLDQSLTMRLFDVWFFENPWVIAAQNTFHSPVVLIVLITVGYVLWKRGNVWGASLFWLACAAMLHTLIDIPLHVDDGPLYLFPLNWELRYFAPISYWDPRYGGREWSMFEHLLDVVLLAWLAWSNRSWIANWWSQRGKPSM